MESNTLYKGSPVDLALGYVLSAAEARQEQWQVMADRGCHVDIDPFEDVIPELYESGQDERDNISESLRNAIQTVIEWRKAMLEHSEEAKRGYHYALVPHEIHVMGRGLFPLDMLRRDQCFPLDEGEAQRLYYHLDSVDSKDGREVIRLGTMQRRLWMPTVERWKSFGWTVVEHKVDA